MVHLDFARRGGMTVFRLHGFGALGPLVTDQHLTLLHAVIHGESGGTVGSPMYSETNHREVFSGRFTPVPRNEHGSRTSS